MDNIEMLKALYDFQAVYPKTISFDEGECFILYQTSAKQRNWWQVVSMKGNIGFVPSNYVTKIKVEPEFLIGFLNSSIESLEKAQEGEINGIISKNELLERLREKKSAMEKLFAEYNEGDGESSLSFSQSFSEKNLKSAHLSSSIPNSMQQQHELSSPKCKRLDRNKKSKSSPSVNMTAPLIMPESASMGSVHVQTQHAQQQILQQPQPQPPQTPQQQQQQQQQKTNNDLTQDNSVMSEPSETTTTTTTTSEDVITTYKEPLSGEASKSRDHEKRKSQELHSENGHSEHGKPNKKGSSEMNEHELEKPSGIPEKDKLQQSDVEQIGADLGNSAENSQALDSENSSTQQPLNGACAAAVAAAAVNAAVTPNEFSRSGLKVESSDVYQIVDVIRRNTSLSFDLSCEALRVVLTSLEQLYNGAINPYLEAVAVHVTDKVDTPKELLGLTHDSKRLQYIFAQLADCKNDSEQRTWMLYEDEDDILQFLEELVEILNNADENISCYEMSCDQYQMLTNLIQYYQMETRWPIKHLLLKTFTAACHIDYIIVDILLTSVLPLEIVEDMKSNFANLDRFKQLVKVLTIIFSLGQTMPVNHQDYLGVHFASFLLEIVEGSNPEVLIDMVISLILAFNLQFNDTTPNVIIEAILNLPTPKVFTEKILLLLNREEDPIKLLKHTSSSPNSVLKMFIDLFSNSDTAGLFYTNDIKVLIDILVRQLSDLCAGNPLRRCYLELCRGILRNTNYQEHQHRKQDLMKIFTRIFCEETECSASDQQLVREIANEFPKLFKA